MRDLTYGKEGRLIFRFAVPMVIGNIFQQLYNIVDSIIVGKYLGDQALAAVGASFPIFYTLISFVIGIGSGATVVISQYFGAKNYDNVKKAIGTLYVFVFGASLILSATGILLARKIFTLLSVGEDVMPEAILYFTVYMSGLLIYFALNSTASILRGLGDSRTPLLFFTIATIANIGLDLLFILVFKWGIAGAAIATIVAQGGTFITAIIILNRRQYLINFSRKSFVFDRDIFKKSVIIGLPTGFQQMFVALGMMALIRIINNFDTAVLAAYTAASRIDALASMPAMNLASALSAFVGQNFGAGKILRIRNGVRATLIMSWCISLAVMFIVIFQGKNLISLFSHSPEVIEYGRKYLIIVSSFYPVFATMFTMHGTLRGAGDTLIPMFITLISLWLIRIPLAAWFSAHIGPSGIWWAIPCGWTIGLIGTMIYYLSGKWKNKKVI
ncbi:MATE family efflux transporter [Thermophagus xiamenensis]|uniref:Multidrug-efflux transporter n=1 Tax=Thermophagus xiamenensis TaxID=385682 RepID=A0A1I2BMU6_9BACT|nr:MATE family efflux transporter [Thermophagus xiamenensis]SFE56623.1 putative efflux protein, MATE family [Thermophagus xiamenensis]